MPKITKRCIICNREFTKKSDRFKTCSIICARTHADNVHERWNENNPDKVKAANKMVNDKAKLRERVSKKQWI